MESKTNYTIVGFFVLVLGSATILVSLWLSVGINSKVYQAFAIYMNEAVSGLSEQSPVKYNGVSVGFVKSISINKDDPQQVLVLVEIEQGTPITTSTTATLMSQGITGLTYVGLKAGNNSTHLLKKEPGEPYPVIPSRPSLLLQLDTAAKEISENFKRVADSIQQFIDKDNAEAVKNSLRNIEEVTDMFASQSRTMQGILKKTNKIFGDIAKSSNEFPQTMKHLRQMVGTLTQAGSTMTQTMKIGQTTLEVFNTQGLPTTINFIEKLDRVANNVETLTKSLNHNPSMIVRGKNPRPLGPGER